MEHYKDQRRDDEEFVLDFEEFMLLIQRQSQYQERMLLMLMGEENKHT